MTDAPPAREKRRNRTRPGPHRVPDAIATPAAHKTVALTAVALIAFAANSLLCRAALAAREIDAATFTSVRLCSGALVLVLLARIRGGRAQGGSWRAAFALYGYAIAFSLAYLRIQAGVGALILFGSVQATMIGSGLVRGEQLGPWKWLGLLVALGGLVGLTLPGARAPDLTGAGLMALAGVAWGLYSLLGRGNADPLASTARNFLLTVPMTLVVSAASLASASASASARGLLLAVASGAIASGLGYTIWYMALRGLKSSTAAIAQLTVPVLAALGAVVLLGEALTPRLLLAGTFVLGGVALALGVRSRMRRP